MAMSQLQVQCIVQLPSQSMCHLGQNVHSLEKVALTDSEMLIL